MAKVKTKKVEWTDTEVYNFIKQELSAKEIMDRTGISFGTLKNKYIDVVVDDKVYNVEGIKQIVNPPKVSKKGAILISKSYLPGFVSGQEFDVALTKDKITLTKIK